MSLDPNYIRDEQCGGLFCEDGDQSLIAHEIIAVLKRRKCANLWLPFDLGPLATLARGAGIIVHAKTTLGMIERQNIHIDALYLGTPTIVANKKLFEKSAVGEWTKKKEREEMRKLCISATSVGARVIVTGLGSGDVTLANRVADMSLPGWTLPKVVCMKDFGDFVDHLLFTERNTDAV